MSEERKGTGANGNARARCGLNELSTFHELTSAHTGEIAGNGLELGIGKAHRMRGHDSIGIFLATGEFTQLAIDFASALAREAIKSARAIGAMALEAIAGEQAPFEDAGRGNPPNLSQYNP